MTQDAGGLDGYLDDLTGADHALAKFLTGPDVDRGMVHTPKEIAQQPFLWRETVRRIVNRAGELRLFLESAGIYAADNRTQVVFAGAGSSDYVGRSIADLLRVNLETPCTNWPTTRLTVSPETFLLPDQRYLVIHFSRSGNSPESTAAFRWAQNNRPETVRQLVITCNPDGKLANLARDHSRHAYLLVLHEGTHDEGLAMTSSFSSMIVAGQALAYLDRTDEFSGVIDRVSSAAEHIIRTYPDTISEWTQRDTSRAFFLGNNDLLGAATESALKLQELTAGEIIAQGEDTMAFRHGPISAVDTNTLVGFFLSSNPSIRRYETDVLDQFIEAFRELDARVVTVGPRPEAADDADDLLTIDYGGSELPPYFQANPAVVVGQLFGLFAAYHRGYHVDNPSKDKALYSRTVQGVTLYDN